MNHADFIVTSTYQAGYSFFLPGGLWAWVFATPVHGCGRLRCTGKMWVRHGRCCRASKHSAPQPFQHISHPTPPGPAAGNSGAHGHGSAVQFLELTLLVTLPFLHAAPLQEIAGHEAMVGQYESYKSFTMPQLYRVVEVRCTAAAGSGGRCRGAGECCEAGGGRAPVPEALMWRRSTLWRLWRRSSGLPPCASRAPGCGTERFRGRRWPTSHGTAQPLVW